MSHRIIRPYTDTANGIFFVVITGQKTIVTASINNVIVIGINRDMCAFASRCGLPIVFRDAARFSSVSNSNGRIVLLRRIDAIRKSIVGGHAVKLRRRLISISTPSFTTVVSHLGTSVIAHNHAMGIFWCNPQIVVVSMGRVTGRKRLSAIGTFVIAYI